MTTGLLDGKVAIVTGASRGIGEAIARRFAMEGARVAVSARTEEAGESRLEGTIKDTVAAIEKAGGTAIAVKADLAKEEDRARLVETARAAFGPIDILVNNAAVTYFVPVASFQKRHYALMFEVQVRAPFELAQLVLPDMQERKAGWILNISSRAAIHPDGPPFHQARRGGTVYGMCKAALERFTTGLAAELYDDNIAVNVLSPDRGVATPGVIFHNLIPQERAHLAEPPSVIAEAALALSSGDPKVLTGQITYSQRVLTQLNREAIEIA